ncbi:DUF4433 domain-containing protein [Homoserinibacter sp. YIM 151385]|uniref:DUF4433 domain-containing protein n=1 Tax=Homoserinibacter sp. YIM 151385 TaxID=2985506 RepID=UPI0022F0C849|nr:DUF4433 domain-containing protein [Homoserinibacter sp. YIM 151385]WBU38372.1 DUF4433 domain-containing protein [Homoserinibacter sp. YIM 151385]
MSHLANLPAILETGEIRPPATAEPGFIPSSATARELRAGIELGGSSLEERVPFSLSPDADRWAELREGAHGVHWSDAARRASIADYVVLVAPLAVLGEGLVLADGDAAAPGTRFADSAEDALRMLRRLHGEGGALTAGEALASAPVAVDRLAIIGVANEPARDRVREMLRSAGLTTKVAVYPPWFQPREA